MKKAFILCWIFSTKLVWLSAQNFYFGADLSYVNEMEDCGARYFEAGEMHEPFELFHKNGIQLARIRLWHTPSFYDTLNSGKRYSDFLDVRRSILRAKSAGMQVLLNFHLSDFWADPNRQLIPKAWEAVAFNLPVLQDSLQNYLSETLLKLHADGLLPEMVQIGNETNRGIMLHPSVDAAGWSLDWARNAALFKTAIQTVRNIAASTGKNIKIALHLASPAESGWLMDGFWANGVRDFDIIGLSYYWAWHKPTTIAETGNIIEQLRSKYPNKSVIIFETGYIHTWQNCDPAANIISEVHPNFSPPSPQNQKKWLTELTQEVINRGGSGVIYWEPAWISTPCRTPWGQGSHQDHATFFTCDGQVLPDGGMYWAQFPYKNLTSNATPVLNAANFRVEKSGQGFKIIYQNFPKNEMVHCRWFASDGRLLATQHFTTDDSGAGQFFWENLPTLPAGFHFLNLFSKNGAAMTKTFIP